MTLGAIAAAIGLSLTMPLWWLNRSTVPMRKILMKPLRILIQKAIHYLFPAMVGSSLSTIVIFLPFILMTGVAGAYFKIMTNTMIITLVCSFFVSWIALPVIYLLA